MPALLQDLIFTPSCIACGRFGQALCNECLQRLKFEEPKSIQYVDQIICAHEYGGWLRDRLIEYKSGNHQLGRGLAEVLVAKCLTNFRNIRLVPIPTSTEKVKQRQIDTIGYLAKQINRLDSNFKITPALKLVKPVTDQVGLTESERFENLKDAFAAVMPISGCVLLLDDVITTGATMSAGAKALKAAGANYVVAIGLCASTKLH